MQVCVLQSFFNNRNFDAIEKMFKNNHSLHMVMSKHLYKEIHATMYVRPDIHDFGENLIIMMIGFGFFPNNELLTYLITIGFDIERLSKCGVNFSKTFDYIMSSNVQYSIHQLCNYHKNTTPSGQHRTVYDLYHMIGYFKGENAFPHVRYIGDLINDLKKLIKYKHEHIKILSLLIPILDKNPHLYTPKIFKSDCSIYEIIKYEFDGDRLIQMDYPLSSYIISLCTETCEVINENNSYLIIKNMKSCNGVYKFGHNKLLERCVQNTMLIRYFGDVGIIISKFVK
jgi:hypothetical protein